MLDKRQFLVKEKVAFMKLTDRFDIFDLAGGSQLGFAKEEISPLMKLLRLVVSKRLLPTKVEVRTAETAPPVMTMKRGFGLLRVPVDVLDRQNRKIGSFKSKLFTLGGGFDVFDARGNPMAEIKGDWKGWNFTFKNTSGRELGKVTKKWAGLGKEFFTSADNYAIVINDTAEASEETVALLLAAGLAVDVIYKEN